MLVSAGLPHLDGLASRGHHADPALFADFLGRVDHVAALHVFLDWALFFGVGAVRVEGLGEVSCLRLGN